MRDIVYQLFIKDRKIKPIIEELIEATDKDFIPKISEKFYLSDVAEKLSLLAHSYVAFVDHTPAGLVSFYFNKRPLFSYLSIICVRPEFRSLNIGKSLEIKCIDYCKSNGSSGIMVHMRRSNTKLFDSRLRLGWNVESLEVDSHTGLEIVKMSII